MANFTSAPIGSTAQSLDGLNVSTSGGPALFLEAVAIGDPTDGGALAPVNSTVGLYVNVASTVAQATNVSVVANQITSSIPFYVAQSSGPWSVQGTTNVQGTSSVNVLGTASTQIISSIPFYVAQSSAPWTVTATATIQGTSSAQIISSIPFFVAQSSAPWTVTATATVQGTSSVNVIGNITIQGTSSVNVLGAIPGTTQVNVVSSLALTIQGTSSVNVISSVVHTVTIQGTSSAQVLGGALNVSAAIFSAAAAAAAPANVVYMGGRTARAHRAFAASQYVLGNHRHADFDRCRDNDHSGDRIRVSRYHQPLRLQCLKFSSDAHIERSERRHDSRGLRFQFDLRQSNQHQLQPATRADDIKRELDDSIRHQHVIPRQSLRRVGEKTNMRKPSWLSSSQMSITRWEAMSW